MDWHVDAINKFYMDLSQAHHSEIKLYKYYLLILKYNIYWSKMVVEEQERGYDFTRGENKRKDMEK